MTRPHTPSFRILLPARRVELGPVSHFLSLRGYENLSSDTSSYEILVEKKCETRPGSLRERRVCLSVCLSVRPSVTAGISAGLRWVLLMLQH